MLDHVSLRVRDYPTTKRFYELLLAPLGYRLLMEFDNVAGFGEPGDPAFWVGEKGVPTAPVHVALVAPSRAAVDAFHEAGLAAGGRDNGAPGLRPRYHEHYYAAFVLDPDGNNIEAVVHTP